MNCAPTFCNVFHSEARKAKYASMLKKVNPSWYSIVGLRYGMHACGILKGTPNERIRYS
jgi:hypothetical protein